MAGIWDDIQYILKYIYLGPIREQLNNTTDYLAQIQKTSKDVSGEGLRVPLHMGRNSGIATLGTTGTATLPTAGKQGHRRFTVLTKDSYASILLYGKEFRATKDDKGAFKNILKVEVEGAMDDSKVDVERQLVMSDTTGQLTVTTTTANSDTVGVASTQYLEAGMLIDIGADTGLEIESVDSATQIITMTAAVDHAAAEVIKRTGVTSGDELNGLALMLSNSETLMGLDVATYPFWKANVRGTAGSPVPLQEMQLVTVCDDIHNKGGACDYIITSYGGRRACYNVLKDRIRQEPLKLKGGFEALAWSAGAKEIPITCNRYWPETATETSFGFLTLKDMALAKMSDFDWMDHDGNVLARQTGTSKKEAYEGTLVADHEHITYARCHLGILTGVTPVSA
jgi:hypothetical protein